MRTPSSRSATRSSGCGPSSGSPRPPRSTCCCHGGPRSSGTTSPRTRRSTRCATDDLDRDADGPIWATPAALPRGRHRRRRGGPSSGPASCAKSGSASSRVPEPSRTPRIVSTVWPPVRGACTGKLGARQITALTCGFTPEPPGSGSRSRSRSHPQCRGAPPRGVQRQGHHRSQGPRTRPRAPRDVHRIHRSDRPAPPRLGVARQLRRRGDGRRVHEDRRHVAGRRRRAASSTTGAASPPTRTPSTRASRARRSRSRCCTPAASSAASGYKVSGGLHGVGVSVVNALSSRLDLEIHQHGGKFEQHYAKGGKPQDKLTRVAGSKKRGTTITFWPDATIFEETEFRAQTILEHVRETAFLNKGLEIRFRDERVDPVLDQTFRYAGGIVDFVKHLNASKEPLFKRVVSIEDTGRGPRHRHRDAVEHRLLRGDPLVRQQRGHHRRRDARGGLQEGPHERDEPLREGQGPPQGQGRQPARRGHPGGAHRDHLGEAPEPAVRGPDQEQARQHRDALARREGHQREARRLARGAPHRGRVRPFSKATQAARARMAARQARDLTRRKSLLESCSDAGQARRLRVAEPGRVGAVHRRGRQRRRQRQARPRPAHAGDPADPRQDPQRRARPPRQDAEERGDPGAHHRDRLPASATTSTSRSSATTRSSSWPTPTSTARTSARCCSRSSTGSSPRS